jgi:hypothetical protein
MLNASRTVDETRGVWEDMTSKVNHSPLPSPLLHLWPVTSTKHGGLTVLKTSVWTNTVRNYIRQEAGEIEAYKALEIGTLEWSKEHILRDQEMGMI